MTITIGGRQSVFDSSPDQRDVLGRGSSATIRDPFCIAVWKFVVGGQNAARFIALCRESDARLDEQPKCLFQRLTRDGNAFQVHVGLEDAYGVLTHISAFADELKELCSLADEYLGIEIHGSPGELAALRQPLAPFRPTYFELSNDAAV